MKKITRIYSFLLAAIITTIIINGCAVTANIASKNGSQLWGENCIRCHNAPPSSDYSGAQWETIGTHMKLRANLTEDEANKIVAYLKSAN
jgi:mono/diheme cytochrome c family protein